MGSKRTHLHVICSIAHSLKNTFPSYLQYCSSIEREGSLRRLTWSAETTYSEISDVLGFTWPRSILQISLMPKYKCHWDTRLMGKDEALSVGVTHSYQVVFC